jgi:hypothetical protein
MIMHWDSEQKRYVHLEGPRPSDIIDAMSHDERADALAFLFGFALGDNMERQCMAARALHERVSRQSTP